LFALCKAKAPPKTIFYINIIIYNGKGTIDKIKDSSSTIPEVSVAKLHIDLIFYQIVIGFPKKSGVSLFICFNQSNIIKKIELVEIYFNQFL
jgi:hypothetical protein